MTPVAQGFGPARQPKRVKLNQRSIIVLETSTGRPTVGHGAATGRPKDKGETDT